MREGLTELKRHQRKGGQIVATNKPLSIINVNDETGEISMELGGQSHV